MFYFTFEKFDITSSLYEEIFKLCNKDHELGNPFSQIKIYYLKEGKYIFYNSVLERLFDKYAVLKVNNKPIESPEHNFVLN